MKKIITPGIQEVSVLECDFCGKEAVSQLVMTSWYGSSHDLQYFTLDFCERCEDEFLKYGIADKFKEKIIYKDYSL